RPEHLRDRDALTNERVEGPSAPPPATSLLDVPRKVRERSRETARVVLGRDARRNVLGTKVHVRPAALRRELPRHRHRPMTSGHLWDAAGLFFGLWLVPMGSLAARSGWLPRPLGRLLIVGGVGYVVSAFLSSMFGSGDTLGQVLTLPATAGEVWIVGYLLAAGVRRNWPSRVASSRT